jgi:hypothetical protein
MPSAQQLTAESDGGLGIATSSITCQHKLHWGFLAFHFLLYA